MLLSACHDAENHSENLLYFTFFIGPLEKDQDNEKRDKGKTAAGLKLFKSKKDLTRTVQKDALRTLKNSKAFQIKRKLDQLKDRKKARLEREKRKKIHNKEAKKSGGKINPRKLKKKLKSKGKH